MNLAFYLAAKGTWFDRLIAAWDHGKFSHVELVLVDAGAQSVCCSSSSRDGGARVKWIDLTDGKWVKSHVPTTPEQDRAIASFIEPICRRRAKYDWLGILGFPLRWNTQNSQRWFCSELCTAALQAAGVKAVGSLDPGRTSPNELHRRIAAANAAAESTANSEGRR